MNSLPLLLVLTIGQGTKQELPNVSVDIQGIEPQVNLSVFADKVFNLISDRITKLVTEQTPPKPEPVDYDRIQKMIDKATARPIPKPRPVPLLMPPAPNAKDQTDFILQLGAMAMANHQRLMDFVLQTAHLNAGIPDSGLLNPKRSDSPTLQVSYPYDR